MAPFIVRRSTGESIWKIGTGNPGMDNVMANIGKKEGILVLLGDILKTLLGLALAFALFGKELGRETLYWSGFGCILGHNFLFWTKGKDRKGVTVTCTWLILLMPIRGTAFCILGGVVTVLTGYLPLEAVLIPAIALPFAAWKLGTEAVVFIALGEFVMLSRHYRDIARIFCGEEVCKFRGN